MAPRDEDDDAKRLRSRVRELEAALSRLEVERAKLVGELDRLQRSLRQMSVTPLLVATVTRVVDDRHVVVRTPTGQEFLVGRSYATLKAGDCVALNQSSLAIVKVLESEVDVYVAAMELDEKPAETYADVGGLNDVIQEVREVVELPLVNPEVFDKMGIDAPAGVLMEGPPGTGKTLVARAVANATHATFIRLVGSELIQKFIGEGARIVRELFQLAKARAPVLLFIDEIDAVASRRTPDSQVSDREVQRTLMQLLAEMDGFDKYDNVKVVAATNRADILDPAILRPGRFDRVIHFPLPDHDGRLEIFKIHTRRMPLDEDVNLPALARETAGFSGADVKAVCTEAGMFAIRHGKPRVGASEFRAALKKLRGDHHVPPAVSVYS
ncbi:MAG: proteasome-activating nucleotidase [Promethearchaeota archaeon]